MRVTQYDIANAVLFTILSLKMCFTSFGGSSGGRLLNHSVFLWGGSQKQTFRLFEEGVVSWNDLSYGTRPQYLHNIDGENLKITSCIILTGKVTKLHCGLSPNLGWLPIITFPFQIEHGIPNSCKQGASAYACPYYTLCMEFFLALDIRGK